MTFASTYVKDTWPLVQLSEVADLIRGVTYAKADAREDATAGYLPILRATNIQESHLILDADLVHVPKENVSKAQLLRVGDIVVATSSGSKHLVGKSAQVYKDWEGSFGAFCAAVRPKKDVESRFVALFLQSPSYWKQVSKKALGVNINNLRRGDIETLSIPLPPINAQREIVAELEKQFSRLDDAVTNLKRVKANLKRYKSAVLKAAVEGRLVSTEGSWRKIQLGDVALSIRNGFSQKPDADHGTRILRISAVRPMELDSNDVRYLSGSADEYGQSLVERGDVLFTRYNGNRDYVGVCALVPDGLEPTVYPDKLIRVRVPISVLLPEFLTIASSTGQSRNFLESKIRTTAGQSGISGGDLKQMPIEFPTISDQRRIVAEVERRLSVARAIDIEVERNLRRAIGLRQAVLQGQFAPNHQ